MSMTVIKKNNPNRFDCFPLQKQKNKNKSLVRMVCFSVILFHTSLNTKTPTNLSVLIKVVAGETKKKS